MPDFFRERRLLDRGHLHVAGLDEAGRGALFGPVVAAAVIFSRETIEGSFQGWIADINDSKKLTPRKRKSLYRLILRSAAGVGCGLATNSEIDQRNIHWASMEAMRRALSNLILPPDFLLVDGFKLNDVNYPQERVFQGDQKSTSIAAASIMAKVIRDEMILYWDTIYKGYSLAKHKGYGTRNHYQAIRELGTTLLHRKTFNLKDGYQK